MVPARHLRNAPITEALIDFRVKPRKDFRAEQFSILDNKIGDEYPISDEHRSSETEFGVKEGAPFASSRDLGLQGIIFRSKDRRNAAQFRIDGFTFNHLKPYTSWEEIIPRAMRLWQLYAEISAPEYISRLALRYINRLPLPATLTGLDKYLTTRPVAPQGYPPEMRSYLTRLIVGERDAPIAAIVTQALETTAPEGLTVILDIDAYRVEDIEAGDDARIRNTLETLRTVKNNIFFGSITEDAVKLFA